MNNIENLKNEVNVLNEKIQELEKGKPTKKYYVDVDMAIDLYNIRNNKNLNKEMFAKRFGVTYQSLVNYQNGRVPVVIDFLKLVMNRTGITFRELVKYKEF